MMTSDTAFVWVWPPGETTPVVAGRLDKFGASHSFTYGTSYLRDSGSVPLYTPELPLTRGTKYPDPTWEAHNCILDAAPDYWGRRVILAKTFGALTTSSDTDDLDLLTYLLESGSDRIGALDFQLSATEYVPRTYENTASLGELLSASDTIEAGQPLSPALSAAMLRGTSIGGARPKALIDDGDKNLIAKFSSSTDNYPVQKAESIAMRLAVAVGLNAAPTNLISVNGRDVLLVERFDRRGDGTRRMMVSALTMLGLRPVDGHYGSYPDLADVIRKRFTEPDLTLRELFSRIVFNIIVGNTDDHARNHAAFWDGEMLSLTPAYDIAPQPRSGGEVNQALAISRSGDKRSRLQVCELAADAYHLTRSEAKLLIDNQVSTVESLWEAEADLANLDGVARARLKGGAFLNQSIFYRD
jgi:serine/threonine-protein kinase HipA